MRFKREKRKFHIIKMTSTRVQAKVSHCHTESVQEENNENALRTAEATWHYSTSPLISSRKRNMRSAVLITGASRGFGRCLALDFAREMPSGDLDLVRAPVCIYPLSLPRVFVSLCVVIAHSFVNHMFSQCSAAPVGAPRAGSAGD